MSRARDFADLAGSADAGGLTGRNILINGAMQVAQRGTSATAADNGGVYLIDRFEGFANGGGAFTMEQSTTVPNNTFLNSAKLVVTTADSSIASADYYSFQQNIEGLNIVQTGYGTSDAKFLSLSFHVRSSITGTYSVACYNGDGSRGYLNTFTISSADTWTEVNLTWEGDTGGTWNKDNTREMIIRFDLGGGSSGHGTANQWTTSGSFAANRTSGSVDWIANNGATFYITGIQLEIGQKATPFEHRSFGDELARCQRYFEKQGAGPDETTSDFNFKSMPVKVGHVNNYVQGSQFAVAKRADPTVVIYSRNVNSGKVSAFATGSDEGNNWSTNAQGKTGFHAVTRDAGTHTVGAGFEYGFTADAEL